MTFLCYEDPFSHCMLRRQVTDGYDGLQI